MRLRSLWPSLTTVAISLGITVLTATPAVAHGINGQPIPDAAQYRTLITAITPKIPGLTAAVDPHGEWFRVTNNTARPLTVLGYAREPYLRVDSSGTSENSYSPTLQLNQSLFGDLSQLGDTALPPSWQHTSSGRTVRWHDHRIHWMGATRPPVVQGAPGTAHLVGNWSIHMLLGSTPVTVTGTLGWQPLKATGSAFRTYVVIDIVIFLLAVAAIAWFWRARRRTGTDDNTDLYGAHGYDPSAVKLTDQRL